MKQNVQLQFKGAFKVLLCCWLKLFYAFLFSVWDWWRRATFRKHPWHNWPNSLDRLLTILGRDKAAGFSVITGVIGSLIGFLCSLYSYTCHLKLRNSLTPFSVDELARHSLTASASSSPRCKTQWPAVNIAATGAKSMVLTVNHTNGCRRSCKQTHALKQTCLTRLYRGRLGRNTCTATTWQRLDK